MSQRMNDSIGAALHIVQWMLFSSAIAFAQTSNVTLSVVPQQGEPKALVLRAGSATSVGTFLPAAWFQSAQSPGRDIHRYKLYQVSNPGTSVATMQDITAQYIDLSRSVEVFGDSPNYTDARILLKQPLHSDPTYLLEGTDDSGNKIDVSITASPSLTLSDAKHVRNHLYVNASVPLKSQFGPADLAKITVSYDPGVGATITYPVKNISVIASQGLNLEIDGKLPAGAANSLQVAVNGITDTYGTALTISGPLTSAPTAPTDSTKTFLTVALSASAATHTAPTFSAAGTFAPVHMAAHEVVIMRWGVNDLHFDPSVVFDVGSTNANATNSVIVPSELIFPELVGRKGGQVSVMNYMGGLRAEVDTQYLGLNLMGEGRIEWYLQRLFRTASAYQAKVSAINPSIRSTLNLPTNGFSITPYVQYDGGGHTTAENIPNPTAGAAAVVVPTFPIARIYFGSQASIQLGQQTISFDGSWINLFHPETAPFTQNTVLQTRTISGLQPHAKGTYAYALDQEKHFSISLGWENGRAAPAFAYLNKFTAGIQVTY